MSPLPPLVHDLLFFILTIRTCILRKPPKPHMAIRGSTMHLPSLPTRDNFPATSLRDTRQTHVTCGRHNGLSTRGLSSNSLIIYYNSANNCTPLAHIVQTLHFISRTTNVDRFKYWTLDAIKRVGLTAGFRRNVQTSRQPCHKNII